jgi:hypothetical protein
MKTQVIESSTALPISYNESLSKDGVPLLLESLNRCTLPLLGGGKRDVLEVARATSWRWKERHLGGGKRDVTRYQLRHGFYGSDTPRRRNSDCVVGI